MENDLCITEKSNVSYFSSAEWVARTRFVTNVVPIYFLRCLSLKVIILMQLYLMRAKHGLLVTQLYTDCKLMYYNLVEETTLLTEQDILNTYK